MCYKTTIGIHLLLQLPGVSYRGRIMIELGMEIGKLPTDQNEKIKLVDQRKLTVGGYVCILLHSVLYCSLI